MARTTVDELKALAIRVSEWRSSEGRGRQIPKELWRDAVEIALRNGAYVTSKATGLAYSSLRTRCAAAKGNVEGVSGSAVARQEVDGAGDAFVSLGPATLLGGRAVVEMTNARGGRLRVEMSNGLDLVAVTRAFMAESSCCN